MLLPPTPLPAALLAVAERSATLCASAQRHSTIGIPPLPTSMPISAGMPSIVPARRWVDRRRTAMGPCRLCSAGPAANGSIVSVSAGSSTVTAIRSKISRPRMPAIGGLSLRFTASPMSRIGEMLIGHGRAAQLELRRSGCRWSSARPGPLPPEVPCPSPVRPSSAATSGVTILWPPVSRMKSYSWPLMRRRDDGEV